jgi:hypothetical protein
MNEWMNVCMYVSLQEVEHERKINNGMKCVFLVFEIEFTWAYQVKLQMHQQGSIVE